MRVAALCLLFTACDCAKLPGGLIYACESDGGCPGGKICRAGFCEPLDGGPGGGAAGGSAGGSPEGGGAGGGGAAGGQGGGLPQGFTWENPQPFGNAINALASRLIEVLAVGDRGLVLHAEKETWTHEVVPVDDDLLGVAYAPTGEALAVGQSGTVLARSPDGGWTVRVFPDGGDSRRSVAWSEAQGAFWVTGDHQTLETWSLNGTMTPQPPPAAIEKNFRAIDSSLELATPSSIYLYDSSSNGWKLEHQDPGDDLFAISTPWAAGATNLGNGRVLQRDAGGWSVVPFATTGGPRYRAVAAFGQSGERCMAVGEGGIAYSCEEQARHDSSIGLDFYAVTHTSRTYAAGRSAMVARFEEDAGTWTVLDVGVTGERCDVLRGLDGTGPNTLVAVGSPSVVLQRALSGEWRSAGAVKLPPAPRAIAFASNRDVWVVGDQGKVVGDLSDGSVETQQLFAGNFQTVAAAPGLVWAAGTGGFYAYRTGLPDGGGAWTTGTETSTTWRGVAITDGGVFMVGGEWLHVPNAGVLVMQPGVQLNDLWAAPSGALYAAGAESDGGSLLLETSVVDPATLRRRATCGVAPYVAIHGTSPDDLWLVENGITGAVVHLTASGCARVPVPFTSSLTDVLALPNDVWVIGRDCAVFHLAR